MASAARARATDKRDAEESRFLASAHKSNGRIPGIEHCFAAYEVLLMAILRAAVNLRDVPGRRREKREKERERLRGWVGFAEVVAADLRLIKVNKPFSLLLSWRLKTEIHGCINYSSGKDRRGRWEGKGGA